MRRGSEYLADFERSEKICLVTCDRLPVGSQISVSTKRVVVMLLGLALEGFALSLKHYRFVLEREISMDLYQYLQSATKSLFRFESLQDYKVGGDGIDDEDMKEWWDFITSKTKAGVLMQRVRLVVEPFTEYTKNELIVHKKSETFGDDIRIIKEKIFNTLNLKQEDFWLVDERIILKMKYSTNGEYLGFDVIENDVDYYIKTKNFLLKNSADLWAYEKGRNDILKANE